MLGTRGLLTCGWAGLETKNLTGLGERRDSFDDLITTTLDAALTGTTEAAA